MNAADYMILELPSREDNVALARVVVGAFAARLDFTLAEIEEIKVAVSEAVTNAVVHGYRESPGVVRIQAHVDDGRLVVSVSDRGVGIEDIAQAREPAFSTVPERMGMGFAFMESFSDELSVESMPGQGTTVRMTKRPQHRTVG
ncbi:MAG: anti-sigma F factor [Bacillota bacterium]